MVAAVILFVVASAVLAFSGPPWRARREGPIARQRRTQRARREANAVLNGGRR